MAELPYRLCAIDLDDTLLGPDHEISVRNARAVAEVRTRGVTVVLASGRMHAAMLRFSQQLDLDTPMISYNGAMVKNPATGMVWLQEGIAPNLAAPILDYCHEHRLQLNYYLNDRLYTAEDTPWIRLYEQRTSFQAIQMPDLSSAFRDQSPTKLIIIDTPEKTNALLPHFRALFGDRLYVTKSNDEYLEFMPPNANKGAALALVAGKLGISAAQTIAFGDSWNDLPMIRWAGLGIAVGNARPELIAEADRVILTNKEDGVAIALNEIFGLNA